MSKHKDKENLENEDILDQMEEEIVEIENEDGSIDEEKLQQAVNPEVEKIKDVLLKTQADFANFKSRTQRDKSDMVFFLKQDIFKKILPSIDDLQRIIKSSSQDDQNTPIYSGIVALEKKLTSDLSKMGVISFDSVGLEVDPDKHDVMTTVPGKQEGIICDEFEKGYELEGKVLRHSKVVVGALE